MQRFRQGGAAALPDRSSRPGRPRHQTPAHLIALIRQLRVTHGLPAWALGRALGVPRSTVSAWLRRLGLNRPPTEPAAPVQRYEWPTAGDMIHVDIKPLGRFRQAGHRVHGDRQRCSPGRAGSTSTWRSTITHAWPTSRSCPINAAPRAAPFSSEPSRGVAPYATSQERRRALRPWVRYYNRERPHASLGYQPPLTRLRSAA